MSLPQGTGLQKKGDLLSAFPSAASPLHLPAQPQAELALAGTWASSEPFRKEGSPTLALGWAEAGAGPADKALLCPTGAASSPINSRIMLGGGPPSLPSRRGSAGAPWEAS